MVCFPLFFCTRVRYAAPDDEEVSGIQNVKIYKYKELQGATDDFIPENKIGQGGFGSVYKGTLKNGKVASIKVLSAESKQGVSEFLAEINAIACIQHENLVKLYGCCVEGNQRMLVYNYLQNNSLSRTLLDFEEERNGNSLYQRMLSALIIEDGCEEPDQHNSKEDFFSLEDTLMQSEADMSPASSQGILNGFHTSSQGHYALVSIDEKVQAELESIGLHPQPVHSDLAEGEAEVLSEEISELKKQCHQEVKKKQREVNGPWY